MGTCLAGVFLRATDRGQDDDNRPGGRPVGRGGRQIAYLGCSRTGIFLDREGGRPPRGVAKGRVTHCDDFGRRRVKASGRHARGAAEGRGVDRDVSFVFLIVDRIF